MIKALLVDAKKSGAPKLMSRKWRCDTIWIFQKNFYDMGIITDIKEIENSEVFPLQELIRFAS